MPTPKQLLTYTVGLGALMVEGAIVYAAWQGHFMLAVAVIGIALVIDGFIIAAMFEENWFDDAYWGKD